ncbi:MAG: zinc-ribbon domain-containing protein [Oscillospiraceae bacterium]|nr:zinc-ribbon domain-containing protein [Oscillospiraceae bacterium]
MAFCSNCGCQLAEGARFCRSCGTPIKANTPAEEPSLDVNISAQITLIGSKEESTKVEIYLEHLDKTIAIDVPNSVSVGQKIRLLGLGYVSSNGKKGNAYLLIENITYKPQEEQEIIVCKNCGKEMPGDAKFCLECGTRVDGQVVEQESQRKTVYEGTIHKCPNCGEILNSFMTNCPSCGYELRSIKTSSPVEALAKKVEQASSLDEKIELIANFYIPNTKEDIYDFFILAVSNLEDKWYDTDDAWRAKLEQAYHKARLSFGNTPEFAYLEKLYIKTRKEVQKRENGIAAIFRRNKVASVTALLIGGGILMMVVGIIMLIATGGEENFGAMWGGMMFAIIGLNFLIAPTWVLEEMKKKEKAKSKKNESARKQARTVISVGKDADDFLNENYEDMAEFLRSRGFRNVVTKAERKGLLDTEGAIKGISVAGNTEFSEDDEFDVSARILIRYYSRNYKGE